MPCAYSTSKICYLAQNQIKEEFNLEEQPMPKRKKPLKQKKGYRFSTSIQNNRKALR